MKVVCKANKGFNKMVLFSFFILKKIGFIRYRDHFT